VPFISRPALFYSRKNFSAGAPVSPIEMKRIAIAALVVGLLVVVAQLIGRGDPQAEPDGGNTASMSPSDRETTFDGVRY
jgi:hypothetical protein